MSFLTPLSLLWLALLLPVVLLLYLLKLRRRPVQVSSVLLWTRLLKDAQANAPLQRLRRSLLLLLQLLILCLAIFALARPFVAARTLAGRRVVVVLDASASMQSRDVAPSRFDAARAEALRIVDAMQPGDRLMVIAASARPRRLTSFTGDEQSLRRAISGARADDTAGDIAEAVGMAVSAGTSAAGGAGYAIVILSDGAYADFPEIDTRGAALRFLRFGSRSHNAGIVAFDIRDVAGRCQAFVAVRNHGPGPSARNVEFYRGEDLIDVRPVDLPPAEQARGFSERTLVLDSLPCDGTILTARLDGKDDLAADDVAFAQSPGIRAERVLLVSEGDLFLEHALTADPLIETQQIPPAAYAGQEGFDVVIFDGTSPNRAGPGNPLYIAAGGPNCPAELLGRAGDMEVTDWNRSHPVLRYVSLQGLEARDAWRARALPWGQEIASGSGGPLMIAGTRDAEGGAPALRSLFVGFSLQQSSFWRRVGFPIFVQNAVHWLGAHDEQRVSTCVRTGETVPLRLPVGVRDVQVTGPDGETWQVAAVGGSAAFQETGRAGIYRVKGSGNYRGVFAAGLASRDETANRPREKLQMGLRPVASTTASEPGQLEVWRWFGLAALLILVVEWLAYHRRL